MFLASASVSTPEIHSRSIIGISYQRLGLLDEAIAESRKAIAWEPKNTTPDPTPFFNLGRVLLKESKPQEALPYLRNAAKLIPESLGIDWRRRSWDEETWGCQYAWHTFRMPGGKLWSISFLVPLCPSESLTSVAAIHGLEASWPERAKLDPVGECV